MLTANEIRTRRKHERLTQENMAAKLGLSRQYLNKIENKKVPISPRLEKRYNLVFGTDRLIKTASRSVKCPYCNELEKIDHLNIHRIAFDEGDNVYQCMTCQRVFTQRESFRLIDEQRKQDGTKK
jgi:transcriptional regulator with XRE-family HTH domain